MLFCSNSAHFSEIQLVCDGWMDGQTNGRTDQRMDGRTDGPTHGHTLLQRCENASKKSIFLDFNLCDGHMDRRTDGPTDRQTDRRTYYRDVRMHLKTSF